MQRLLLGTMTALLLTATAAFAAEGARLQWFGHAAFQLTTPGGQQILIDPFLTANPLTPEEYKDLARFGGVDLILVTHAHGDHFGDTAKLAALSGAPVAVNSDFGSTLLSLGVVPKNQLIGFNKSGPITPIGDDVTITMVHAEHSSEFTHGGGVHPAGAPAGFIVEMAGGPTIWHMGDTGVFAGMKWIARYYQPDVVLMPIGGHYTMDPEHAAYAVERFLRSATVIPIHYGTFGALTGTPEAFKSAVGETAEVVVMQPGETLKLP